MNFKLNFLSLFGLGPWILVGMLTPSSEGLSCYNCVYGEGHWQSSEACLDPVKDKATMATCSDAKHVCSKRTEEWTASGILPGAENDIKVVLLYRSCHAPSSKPCSTKTGEHDGSYGPTYKWKSSHTIHTCYCKTKNCNNEAGVKTNLIASSGRKLEQIGATTIFIVLVSLPLKFFLLNV